MAELPCLHHLIPHHRDHLGQPPPDDRAPTNPRSHRARAQPAAAAEHLRAPVRDVARRVLPARVPGRAPRRGDLQRFAPADVDPVHRLASPHPHPPAGPARRRIARRTAADDSPPQLDRPHTLRRRACHGPAVGLRMAACSSARPWPCSTRSPSPTRRPKGQSRPIRWATAAAWVRLPTPSLRRMRETCTLAVFSAMYSEAPI